MNPTQLEHERRYLNNSVGGMESAIECAREHLYQLKCRAKIAAAYVRELESELDRFTSAYWRRGLWHECTRALHDAIDQACELENEARTAVLDAESQLEYLRNLRSDILFAIRSIK